LLVVAAVVIAVVSFAVFSSLETISLLLLFPAVVKIHLQLLPKFLQ